MCLHLASAKEEGGAAINIDEQAHARVLDHLEGMLTASSGILLDFDGVLADSEPLFHRSWNTALKPWGHSIPEEEYWLHWSSLGEGLDGEIKRKGLTGIDRERARACERRTYTGLCKSGDVPLFPHTPLLLKTLIAEESSGGRPFCIASNTPSGLVKRILTIGGAPVPRIVGGENLRRKPAPDIFLAASDEIGTSPSETLVFEDTWKGAMAANRGGFPCIVVLNRLNASLDIPAELKINGIKDILAVLNRINR